MENEIWIDINNRYSLSNLGRVRSNETNSIDNRGRKKKRKGRLLKFGYRKDGYVVVNVSGYKHRKNWKIHQLVAQHFIKNPEGYKSINHINGNKLDNRVVNLEWCTQSHNIKHAYLIGLMKPVRNYGLKNGYSKIVFDFMTGVYYYSACELSSLIGMKRTTLTAKLSNQNINDTKYKYV